MRAITAAKRFGNALISCTIRTQPMGDWPGGLAKIKALFPEKDDKEIVFQVKGTQGQGEIGLFKYEQIEIV